MKEKLPIFLINTLLLHIPLLALTDRRNYRQRNELILVGLGNLRFLQVNPGWAGSSTVPPGKTHTYTTRPHHTTSTKMSSLCPIHGGFSLSFHRHVSSAPNLLLRSTIWLHGKQILCGLAALWTVPLLGG
jgi:hypothetical protein